MPEHEDVFEQLAQDGQMAKTSRMIREDEPLAPNRADMILRRAKEFLAKHEHKQADVAKQIRCSKGVLSEVLRGCYKGDATAYLRRLNNWMELEARRKSSVQSRDFVKTSVAREIIKVAEIVAETCKMGVVFGPAHIGKTFTLRALEGDDRLGSPVLLRINEAQKRPFPICRLVADKFDLKINGTFDVVARRVVKVLDGTKRMLMFDEIDRAFYPGLEYIRDLHDETGCPILLCGKPKLYEKLGFRQLGELSEVVDQLGARIVIKRDLTERTRRRHDPEPLFTIEDIRKLITHSNLQLRVDADGVRWLQSRASTIGLGGVGKVMTLLHLAAKYARGDHSDVITAEILSKVEDIVIGHEDAERVSQIVEASSGRQRRVG